MIMLAMLAFTFTSCEDEEIAQNLAGNEGRIWQGTISKYYQDRWGFSGDHYRTVMEFEGDPWHYTSGRGYEVDYDMNDPYGSYWYSEFDWSVRNREIELRYADTGYKPVYISDYYLSNNRFEGFMDDGTNSEIRFSLYLIEDFDWSRYNGHSYFDGFRYAPRKAPAASKEAPAETVEKVKFASKGAFAKKSAAETK